MKGRLDYKFRHPGESIAWNYLQKKDHRLLRHNYHVGFCELDLITIDNEFILHVIEVKSWKKNIAHPLESFDSKKITKTRRAIQIFLEEASFDSIYLGVLRELNPNLKYTDLSVSFGLVWVRDSEIEMHEMLF